MAISKVYARYRRSTILRVLALASLVYVAIDQFDIPPREMAWLLVYVLAGVLSVIVIAGITVAIWMGLRKLIRRN